MPRPRAPPPNNPLKNRTPIKAGITPLQRRAQEAAAAKAKQRPPKRACPNPECTTPDIQEGICHNCGTVVDDSNIVSEIQFGESSSGAAVVQGSFIGADQGAARGNGPLFTKQGTGQDRESTLKEGRRIMQNLAAQLEISENVVNQGHQIFKLCAMHNFIQGRRMEMVTAVCLYSACRKERPCRVMLIDFADKLQVNVFKLGATFKKLHTMIPISADGHLPVLPEDLIRRFAMKLEFGVMTNKVAEDAIRMVKRMSLDWMVMGRRPSGVCGACLILAARMNNFRRTVTEVVYIVKVTTHTIQKRLEEFKQTPSSALTIDEFLHNEFLESAHDPPSFYEKTEEFQKNKKKRKRKNTWPEDEEGSDAEGSQAADSPNKRQNATESTTQTAPATELRRDADGFAIPPAPQAMAATSNPNIDPALLADAVSAVDTEADATYERLVTQFGDEMDQSNADVEAALSGPGSPSSSNIRGREIQVPEEWDQVEEDMISQIDEIINDPTSAEHTISYAKARKRAAYHMLVAERINPQKEVNMDVHIGEDEFKDDPEVQNCVLSPEDSAKKELVWTNENKSWLRKQQIKLWQQRQAENAPPKARRNRKKKPRVGEGQTSAASTPGEAAVGVMKQRAFSKKINYAAIEGMFKTIENSLGSAATSRVTSRAGSEYPESETESRASSVAPSDAGSATTETQSIYGFPKAPRKKYPKKKAPVPAPEPEEEEEGDDSDYISAAAPVAELDDEEEVEDWKSGLKRPNEDMDEEEEYDDYGDIEPGGLGDETGFDNMEDAEDEYEHIDDDD